MIKNGIVVSMDEKGTIIVDGAVIVEGDRIKAIGPSPELEDQYDAGEVIDAKGGVIMPGFICNHCHTHGQAYIGEPLYDLGPPPITFLQVLGRDWWPKLEDALTKDDVYNVARYTCSQLMKNGFTYVLDVMEAPVALPGVLETEAKALLSIGMRGRPVQEATERISVDNGELGLKENLNFALKYKKENDSLVKGALCAHTVWSCSEEMLRHMRELANKHGIPMTMHVNESPFEADYSRKYLGKPSFVYLDEIGVLGPDFLAAQAVQSTEEECKIIAEKQVKISHNIQTNMMGGDGLTPIKSMLELGVTCGMGNDGFYLDPFENLRVIQQAHRGFHRDASLFPSEKLLAFGTIENAKTVWMENNIGSLEVGKKADLIILDLKAPGPVLKRNVLDMIVNHGYGTKTKLTMIDGRVTVKNRKLVFADEDEIYADMVETVRGLWDRGPKAPLPVYQIYKLGKINEN
ncbi:MAG: amidohydrolase family protein [Candidatus Ranarchaeia archaeon]